ncbi:unnamed protein product [Periconia digitata]|uniref:Uncharacterized protein n=1 Tax=Periconia digitata TaxID=1303443 RepID=A0A9W4UL04_9PLEO|nr:unnamed protein product [Periconia digitata]
MSLAYESDCIPARKMSSFQRESYENMFAFDCAYQRFLTRPIVQASSTGHEKCAWTFVRSLEHDSDLSHVIVHNVTYSEITYRITSVQCKFITLTTSRTLQLFWNTTSTTLFLQQ